MTRRMTKYAAIAAAAAAASLALAGTAQATPCSGSNPSCTVQGQVSIPTSLTLSLDATSFSLNAVPGKSLSTGGTGTSNPGTLPLSTVPSSYAVNATVTTNNSSGYMLSESLGSTSATTGKNGFVGATSGAYLGHSNTTWAWSYPSSDSSVGAGGSFSQAWGADTGAGGLGSPVVSQATASAPAGDSWGLALGWQLDNSSKPDSYSGFLSVVALA